MHDILMTPDVCMKFLVWSYYYHDVIVAGMDVIRTDADTLEQLTDKKYWPYPTYSDLLFY